MPSPFLARDIQPFEKVAGPGRIGGNPRVDIDQLQAILNSPARRRAYQFFTT
jgi:hypothetical protein